MTEIKCMPRFQLYQRSRVTGWLANGCLHAWSVHEAMAKARKLAKAYGWTTPLRVVRV